MKGQQAEQTLLGVHIMKKVVAVTLFLLLATLVGSSSAAEMVLFESNEYTRTKGKPNKYVDSFLIDRLRSSGKLVVLNGDKDGKCRTSSAIIFFNGEQIFGPSDFNQQVDKLEVPVDLAESNTVSVELRGKPGSYVTVSVTNNTPVANSQSISIEEDSVVAIILAGSDVESDVLIFALDLGPTHGILAGKIPNLTYTPHPDYNSSDPDTFTFTVNDGASTSAPGTISIKVTPVNDPPQAGDDTASTQEDNPLSVDLLANDTDVDGDVLTVSSFTQPSHCSVTQNGDGTFTYEPAANFYGTGSFTYTVSDGNGSSAEASVTVTINAVNDSPVANDDTVTTNEDTPVDITLQASDIEGDALTYQIVSEPTHGTLHGTAPNVTYTPNLNSFESDGFTFIVNDGAVDSQEATVSIDVTALNDAPVASAGSDEMVFVTEIVQLDGSGSVDVDGDDLTYSWLFVSFPGDSPPAFSGASAMSPEFEADVAGTYVVQLIVSDNAENSEPDSVTITAEPMPSTVEPQPEGSFGGQYNDLIPPDATIESYDARRFSVITGLVQDLAGDSIKHVTVAIHNHSEYGTVKTDADGRFSIPVEGGTTITVVYEKEELIPAHRNVDVPWNDISVAETIVMIAQDAASTAITFDGNPDTIMTHQSTEVTEEPGTRSVTMVFTGDNMAYEVDGEGNVIGELTTITTQATEFTTPESMPAKLPPNSAYTYCVELSVDEAQRVKFEKPVIIWVDNFLGFDVGTVVPVGYYDRDRGVWVPSDNGVVVKLLNTDTDDSVDALDATGDDQPDDLDGDGSFSDEVIGLGDPLRYRPGSTFWRVAVPHFTPWDWNWPFGLPSNAIAANPPTEPVADQKKGKNKTCLTHMNSFVEDRSRIFHEDIPIPGTDITLHYASDRVDGYQHLVTVPASGATVPASLKSILVRVDVAGRTFEQTLEALPNQKAEFVWDGLDYLGRPVKRSTTANVAIGFVYGGVYLNARSDVAQAFGQDGIGPTVISARQEIVLWRRSSLVTHRAQGVIGEGWTLSPHHQLNLTDLSTLHKGDGTITTNNASIIDTVAGTGTAGYGGDGGPATEAQLRSAYEIDVDAAGAIYIVDTGNSRIRKVDSSGIITTVAGNGSAGGGGDGGPATQAQLFFPVDVAVDAAGNIYIAQANNHRIRKVDTSGIITTVAGNGSAGYRGDGGPATEARLYHPWGVAVDGAGNLYIAGYYSHRVRKVDTNGIITTVAGNGSAGYGGDGGRATQARLNRPIRVAADSAGNLYIADEFNQRIRKVDSSGIITTVAGNGAAGYQGDGGPATQAQLFFPFAVTLDAADNIYIGDLYNHRIRKVDSSGIITTVAGTGIEGYAGDGGPATQAQLRLPYGLALDAAGNLYVAEPSSRRIRKVAPPSAFADAVTAGYISFTEENGMGYIMSNAGRHKTTIDLDTGVSLYGFGYNEDNELAFMTDRFGNQTTIQRDANGIPTAITSPDGITTTLTIDADNHLTHITYADDSFYSFEYRADGLMTAETEPEGSRFEHVFDSLGRLTDVFDDEGGHWNYSRQVYGNGDILIDVVTGEGNLTSYLDHTYSTGRYTSTITGPTGAETVFSQSADGLTVEKSLACGMELEFKYGLDPQYKFKYVKEMRESTPSALEKVTLREKTYQDTNADNSPDLITETVKVNGKTTTRQNNVVESQSTITSAQGRTVTALYDPDTLLTSSLSIPGLYDTTYGYDERGSLTSITTSTRETSFTYNAKGFLASITDPENHTTSYTYDPVGRVTGINRPDTSTVGFTYDNNGNMTVLTNPASIDHGFGYNGVNLNSSYQTPVSSSYYSYVYDKDRRLIQAKFPSGDQINNIYDKTQLVQIQTPEGNIDLTYLCSTKVGSIANGTDTITYEYDGSLVTAETLNGTLNESLDYAYNNNFNLKGFTYAGDSVSYTYDNDGLLTGAGDFTISRNSANGLPESVSGGDLSLSRPFNGHGEVASQDFVVNSSPLTSWNLTRDDNGRIIAKTETVDGATSNYDYTYDAMGRLLTVTKDSTLVEEYDYDGVGTRIYENNVLRGVTRNEGDFAYSVEDCLLSVGGTNYEYNADGFLTTKTQGTDVTMYDYSSRGELLSVTLPDTTFIEYVHDPLGRRIAKKVDGAIVEKYLWQGLTRLLAVYDESSNTTRFEYAAGRMPVAMTKGGATYYLTYDQVGSLRIVADSAGSVVKRIEYDSFGNIINDTDPLFEIPFGFAGGLHDRDTGLVRFGCRDYAPDIGRWTAKDPILFAGGDVDLYGYCLSDPVNLVDPDGQFVFAGAAALGFIGYTAVAALADLAVVGAVGWAAQQTILSSGQNVTAACLVRPAGPTDLGPLKGAPSLPYPGANIGSPDPNLPPPPDPDPRPKTFWEKIKFVVKEGMKRLPYVLNPPS